jgi:hypothetical protein
MRPTFGVPNVRFGRSTFARFSALKISQWSSRLRLPENRRPRRMRATPSRVMVDVGSPNVL